MSQSQCEHGFPRNVFGVCGVLIAIMALPGWAAERAGVQLNAEQQAHAGLQLAVAGPMTVRQSVIAPGKVLINADRIAHVIPRVTGVVRDVRKSTGDAVMDGELMAVIESMEIADARANYFAAEARKKLAAAVYKRKELLWKEEIASRQAYEEAQQAMELAQVEERSAIQKLIAMDMPLSKVKEQANSQRRDLSRYEIRAPFTGQILERDMVLGEATQPNVPVFVLGNLDTVWVDLNVYPKDIDRISIGEPVKITAGNKSAMAKIIHIRPVVSEESRATAVRALLENQDRRWQPGLFVSGEIFTEENSAQIAVNREAVLTLHNQDVVFVREGDEFKPRTVQLGVRDLHAVEILQGLQAGETYVATGAFVLKSELEKNQ